MGTIDSATGNAEVEFTVKREKASIRYYGHETPADSNGIYAHLFNLSGTNTRYYTAELYRIESARGAVTGLYGTREATRAMTMPTGKIINDSIYTGYSHKYNYGWTFITNHSVPASDPANVALKDLIEDKNMENYLKQCGTNIKVQISDIEYYVNDHETQMWTYLKSTNGSFSDKGFYNFPDDEDDDEHTGHFRMGNTWNDVTWSEYDNGGISFWGNKVGGGHADVHYIILGLKPSDVAGPDQVGIAPAATTNYKKGDKVKFSVVFDELISDYSNVTVDTSKFSKYMPINNVTCTGGKGTNILTFEGTATKDFENGTFSNGSGTNDELMDIKPVNGGTIKDIKGNNRAS